MKREIYTLRKEIQKKYTFNKSIIGESPTIKVVYERIESPLLPI